jgi:hypothetical protein
LLLGRVLRYEFDDLRLAPSQSNVASRALQLAKLDQWKYALEPSGLQPQCSRPRTS